MKENNEGYAEKRTKRERGEINSGRQRGRKIRKRQMAPFFSGYLTSTVETVSLNRLRILKYVN
jgi:hypothetical protein